MPKTYKHTTEAIDKLQTPKKRQNNTNAIVTLADIIQSVIIFAFLIGVLFIITAFAPQNAHGYSRLATTPASQYKNNLLLGKGMGQNTATTKYIAVKPSRHTLAIFVPVIHGATNPMITTSTKSRHNHAHSVTSYDGLIRGNTRPKGNTPSRLYTVVESRHPLPLANVTFQTTKYIGVANNG